MLLPVMLISERIFDLLISYTRKHVALSMATSYVSWFMGPNVPATPSSTSRETTVSRTFTSNFVSFLGRSFVYQIPTIEVSFRRDVARRVLFSIRFTLVGILLDIGQTNVKAG